MRITREWKRVGRRLVGWVMFVLLPTAGVGQATGLDKTTRLDCGVNALYVLLSLEGHPVALERLLSTLPARHPDGYSMAELSDAAGSFGLSLEGVTFAQGDKPPVRPAIAFLKDEKGGHFTVLRPVGATGTMVQVIDPPLVPWIADYDRVLASRPWKGRILVPRDPWSWRRPILFLTACVMGVALALLIRPRASRTVLA